MRPKSRPVKSPRSGTSFAWQDHHFINRLPALDFANTVVYRRRPDRCDDRLTGLADVDNWRRRAGAGLGPPRGSLKHILRVRETIDRFFRQAAASQALDAGAFRQLMRLYARHAAFQDLEKTAKGLRAAIGSDRSRSPPLLAGVLQSAVELAFSPDLQRVKICPACGWLFIDRTRNRSKRWCITALCGNRSKMRRHYHRRLARTSVSP